MGIKCSVVTKVIKIWEDSEVALKLAISPIEKVTPHTEHFTIKYHWSREELNDYRVVMKYVDTNMI